MKQLTTLALLLGTLSLSAQNVSEETRAVWRGTLWQNSYKTNFQYDNNQNKTLEFGSQWNNESLKWENNVLKFYTYNELGKETEKIEKNWNQLTGEWENAKKYNYTYSGNNQELLTYNWKNGSWIANEQFLITTDANNDIIEIVNNFWDAEANVWKIENKKIYTYLSKGKISTYTILRAWPNSTELENAILTEITYNTAGKRMAAVSKYWDKQSNQWIISGRTNYIYNSNGFLTEDLFELWDNVQQKFLINYKNSYELNNKGEILSTSSFSWDELKQEWEGTFRQNNQLNELGLSIESIKQNFHPDVLEWLNAERITKVYSNATGLNNIHALNLEIYPNPAKDRVSINGLENLNYSFEVYALDGKLLLNGTLNKQAQTIDISQLQAGFYLLNISSENGQFTQKLIKE